MKVLGITGLPGSGKSEFASIAEEMGFTVVRMGDMVWNYVRSEGLPLSARVVGEIAKKRREREGADIWARETVKFISSLPERKEVIVIDGLRSLEEVEYFRGHFPEFRIVGVHSSPSTRYRRIMARKRVDDVLDFTEFQAREQREIAWGIAVVFAYSDIMLVNEGGLEDFRMRARLVLRED